MKILSREEYQELNNHYKATGYCPFCDLPQRQQEIIWQGKYRYLLHNIAPYSGDQKHVLAVPTQHIILKTELDIQQLKELKEVYHQIELFFGEKTYFSFTRETSNDDTRSIDHLHMHFLVGRLRSDFLIKMLEL